MEQELTAQNALAKANALVLQRLAALSEDKLCAQIQVHWNPRLRSTAGRAWPKQLLIELNPRLLSLPKACEQIERTALHEAAHVLAFARHPRRRIQAHGIEWQQACKDLGIPGEKATHRLPLPRHSQAKKYRYQCPHCKEIFARARAIKRPLACAACCKKFANNRYDKRFRLRLMDS